MFLGFLESGKTTLIKTTLTKKQVITIKIIDTKKGATL